MSRAWSSRMNPSMSRSGARDGGRPSGIRDGFRRKVHRRKMREGGRADLALVGPVGPVGDKIDTKFTLGCLDRRIYLSGWNAVAFGIELEVFDHCFHRTLHFATPWRNNLVIPDGDRSLSFSVPKLFDALLHDAHRLTHLLHAHEIAIITVAMLPNGNIEIKLRVAFVRLCLAQVPLRAGPAHHHA